MHGKTFTFNLKNDGRVIDRISEKKYTNYVVLYKFREWRRKLIMNNVEEKTIEMISEVLGIDAEEEEVTLDSEIVNDLGAESIDFIDICFQIEKLFKVGKVKTTDIFSEDLKDDVTYSEEKLEKLIEDYPFVSGELLNIIKTNKDFTPLLTVRAISAFVEWRLANAN